jgi:hypothetical protein
MSSERLTELAVAVGLRADSALALSSGGGNLELPPMGVDPYDFLDQAERDYEAGGNAACLNALTNAKRAIVSQMDQALTVFGYKPGRWNIPKKIEVLNSLGLVAPRILKKVSDSRNLLEHEYKRPSEGEVLDALDLAALFVFSMKSVFSGFEDEFALGNEGEQVNSFGFGRELTFTMADSQDMPRYTVWAHADCGAELVGRKRKLIGQVTITAADDVFPNIVRLALASARDFRVEQALKDFCLALKLP